MTKAELIEAIKDFPDDAKIFISEDKKNWWIIPEAETVSIDITGDIIIFGDN